MYLGTINVYSALRFVSGLVVPSDVTYQRHNASHGCHSFFVLPFTSVVLLKPDENEKRQGHQTRGFLVTHLTSAATSVS